MAVEGKRADVALLVLLLLVEPLLKFAMLLEAVLLGHQALLLIALHLAALTAEYLHLAVEHLVLTEFALQRAVVKGNFDTRLQAYLVETLLAIGEYPGVVAGKLMLQPLANHLVGAQQVGRGDTLAVGWVGNDDAFVLGLLKQLEVLLLNGDSTAQAGGLHVASRRVDGLHVDVVAVDVAFGFTLVVLAVVVDAVEEVGVEVGPLLKGILLAEESRRHVVSNEGSLDKQCARPAHRIDEIAVALPSREQNHAGGEHLVERRFHGLLPVTAAVQGFATGVET